MGLLDFFGKRQKLSTVLPQIPFNGQVAIQQGIITSKTCSIPRL